MHATHPAFVSSSSIDALDGRGPLQQSSAIFGGANAVFPSAAAGHWVEDGGVSTSSMTSMKMEPPSRILVPFAPPVFQNAFHDPLPQMLQTSITNKALYDHNVAVLEAISLFNKALVHQINGDIRAAKYLLDDVSFVIRDILRFTQEAPSDCVLELAMRTFNNLGLINYVERKLPASAQCFENAIGFAKQLVTSSETYFLEYATILSNWCRIVCASGELNAVLRMRLKEILDIRCKVLTRDHMDISAAHFNVAVVEYAFKNTSEAVSHLVEYLAISSRRSQNYKANELDDVPAVTFLLIIKNEDKEDEVSQDLVRLLRLLQVKSQTFDANSSQLTSIYNCVGSLLFRQRDFEYALVFFQAELRLEINDAKAENSMPLQEESMSTRVTCNNIGRVLQELGRHQEALTYYERVLLAEYGAIDNLSPSSTVRSSEISLASANLYSTVWYNLGLVQDKLGLYSPAVRSFQMSLKLRQDMLGRDHSDVACLFYNIGVLQMEQQQLENATASLNETLRICQCKKVSQLSDMHIIKALERLASLYEAKSDSRKTIEILQKILCIQRSSVELDDISRAQKMGATLRAISETQLSTDQLPLALRSAVESVKIFRYLIQKENVLPNDSSETILDRLANVERLVSSLLLLGSIYHEMCETIRAHRVLCDAAMITRKSVQAMQLKYPHLIPPSLLAMSEVTSMLSSFHCAPQA
jgi:tetratricopeptide (TPR) repeat protein